MASAYLCVNRLVSVVILRLKIVPFRRLPFSETALRTFADESYSPFQDYALS